MQAPLRCSSGLRGPQRASQALPQAPRLRFSAVISTLATRATGEGPDPLPKDFDMEKMMFMELIAQRRQVDRLLDQQGTLISLLAASFQNQGVTLVPPGSAPPALGAPPPTPQLPGATPGARPALPPQAGPGAAAPGSYNPSFDANAAAAAAGGVGFYDESTSYPAPSPSSPTSGTYNPSFDMGGMNSSVLAAIRAVEEGDVLTGAGPIPQAAPQQQRAAAPAPATSGSGSPVDVVALASQLPIISQGVRDAFWMERLHVALLARGYYAGDDDVQSWTFGEGTREAVTNFQADERLAETGVADASTWAELLSALPDMRADLAGMLARGAPPLKGAAGAPAARPAPPPAAPSKPEPVKPQIATPLPARGKAGAGTPPPPRTPSPIADQKARANSLFVVSSQPGEETPRSAGNPSFDPVFATDPEPFGGIEFELAEEAPAGSSAPSEGNKSAANGKPPRMERGDRGGFFMEVLHAALLRAGADPSYRDVESGRFGQGTEDAINGFQASRGLPQTGMVDDATWALLLLEQADLRAQFIQQVAASVGAPASADTGPVPPKEAPITDPPAASMAASSSQAAPSSSGQGAKGLPVEQAKLLPGDGNPPELVAGDDDIAWVSRLHAGLIAAGFYPPDEEAEEWIFGEGTREAVLTLQASAGLPETGIVDRWTWVVLCRSSAEVHASVNGALSTPLSLDGPLPTKSSAAPASATAAADSSAAPPAAATGAGSSGGDASSSTTSTSTSATSESAASAASLEFTEWPVLMEGDGGKEVQLLQMALESEGFHCGDDEAQWWMFGADTLNALKTYQACSSLPETGVCDARTWVALLGGGADAKPQDLGPLRARLLAARSDEEGEDDVEGDLSDAGKQGRVWLVGEQRWEKKRS